MFTTSYSNHHIISLLTPYEIHYINHYTTLRLVYRTKIHQNHFLDITERTTNLTVYSYTNKIFSYLK